jgi:glycerol-3-phosphate dehydrogenase
MKNFEVAVIGGGVVGCAVAWDLSHYDTRVVVFERGCDVGNGASMANSGVVHSGINSPPSSLKAFFCVKGNGMMQSLADNLGFPLKWVGKYVVAKNEDEIKNLERLEKTGAENGVPGLEIQDGDVVKKKEPNVSCEAALWVPTAGIISPYEFTIALAENAVDNNVRFMLETKVIGLKKVEDGFEISTNRGEFYSDVVVNAAGICCKEILSMLEEPDFQLYPCRGEYLVLDKNVQGLVTSMIYPVPQPDVLGVHITPTVEGNILLGPSAEYVNDPSDVGTTRRMMKTLLEEARDIIPALPADATINAYAGMRCKLAPPGRWADYRIEESKNNPGFINLLGIESPGLTAAPAVANEVTSMISKTVELRRKTKFKQRRRRKRFSEMSPREQNLLINEDNRWGRIVCRCEHVTEKEIIDALSNPLGAKAISSVKYRCRAGMGRCQGGFCMQHIVRIMEEYFNMDVKDMKLKSPGSYLFSRRTR